jgi:hypothetical protein
MTRGGVSMLAGIAVILCLIIVPSAGAVTVLGDYQLQGTHSSSGPGPALTNIGPGNAFKPDNVMGIQRTVLAFPQGSGLQMAPAGITGDYSEVVTFRFDTLTNYRRILDSTNGGDDDGLYSLGGTLDYFDTMGNDRMNPSAVLADHTYATVALVMRGSPLSISGYLNGSPAMQFVGGNEPIADTLRFFKDNSSTEQSAGAVSCIRVYSGALSPAEVAAIGASPTCAAPAPPTTPVKRCKKHKKKHRAAEAKKKCKKHKKKR